MSFQTMLFEILIEIDTFTIFNSVPDYLVNHLITKSSIGVKFLLGNEYSLCVTGYYDNPFFLK
jgi:hypothetical protein